jgi:hypothetical protein
LFGFDLAKVSYKSEPFKKSRSKQNLAGWNSEKNSINGNYLAPPKASAK